MEDVKPEEKSPLLLYMVDNEGSSSTNNKRMHFEKGRLYGITSGATAVFTEFPNYISPCWISTVLSSLIFFMTVTLMISSMSTSNSLRVPRCTHKNVEELDNRTVHLVHGPSEWNQEELAILMKIKEEYQAFTVHLVLIGNGFDERNNIKPTDRSTTTTLEYNSVTSATQFNYTSSGVNEAVIEIKRAKRSKKKIKAGLKRRKRDPNMDNSGFGLGMGMKSLLDILLHSRGGINTNNIKKSLNETELLANNLSLTAPTLEEPQPQTLQKVIQDFPNLKVRNVTFEEVFSKSPLEKTWPALNPDLQNFAVRILHLWQYGGLSFKIDGRASEKSWENVERFTIAPEWTLQNLQEYSFQSDPKASNNKLLGFISSGKQTYDKLPFGVVTADDEGLHIFSKMPCHAFFGEILLNLKYAKRLDTVKDVIKCSLEVFCKHAAVGRNYCDNMIKKRG